MPGFHMIATIVAIAGRRSDHEEEPWSATAAIVAIAIAAIVKISAIMEIVTSEILQMETPL